MVHTA